MSEINKIKDFHSFTLISLLLEIRMAHEKIILERTTGMFIYKTIDIKSVSRKFYCSENMVLTVTTCISNSLYHF